MKTETRHGQEDEQRRDEGWRKPPLLTRSLLRGLRVRGYRLGKFRETTTVAASNFSGRIQHDNLSQEIKNIVHYATSLMVDIKIWERIPTKFIQETRALTDVCRDILHPNMCLVYGLYEINDRTVLTSEHGEGIPLHLLINHHSCLLEAEARIIYRQIISCFTCCHQRRLLHYNLTPASIKVGTAPSFTVKIMDFGVPPVRNKDLFGKALGADRFYSYIPPEVLRLSGRRWEPVMEGTTQAANIYSLGVILYEMLTGQVPYSGSRREVLHQIMDGRPDFYPFMSTDVVNLLEAMLQADPGQRPAAADCLHHPWTLGTEQSPIWIPQTNNGHVNSHKDLGEAGPPAKKPVKKVTYSQNVEVKYIPRKTREEREFYRKMNARIKAYKRAQNKQKNKRGTRSVHHGSADAGVISSKTQNTDNTSTNHAGLSWSKNVLKTCRQWRRNIKRYFQLNLGMKNGYQEKESVASEHPPVNYSKDPAGGNGKEEWKGTIDDLCGPGLLRDTECDTLSPQILLPVTDQCYTLQHDSISLIEQALTGCFNQSEDIEQIRTDRYVTNYKDCLKDRLNIDPSQTGQSCTELDN